ncbi:hypothetical protein DL771_002787 [Monosporascus sp. 5C6A]|nr:hypothetical protein DL771_002787 [Monosporascus sp. 5C6A]
MKLHLQGDVSHGVVANSLQVGRDVVFNQKETGQVSDSEIKEWLYKISNLQSPEWKTHSAFFGKPEMYLEAIEQPDDWGQWLLDNASFREWRDGTSTRLWCHGKPQVSRAQGESPCIYIYFEDERGSRRQFGPRLDQSPGSLIKNLLAQLVSQRDRVSDRVRKHHTEFRRAARQLKTQDALALMNSEAASFKTVYVVVDALEKCPTSGENDFRHDFLNKILELNSKFKILVTSVYHRDIQSDFAGAASICITPAAVKDLKRYIKKRIHKNVQVGLTDADIWDNFSEAIIDKSNGMFLRANQILNLLGSKKRAIDDLQSKLKQLPSIQNEIYEASFKRITEQEQPEKQRAIDILLWLTYAMRPLTMDELKDAISQRSDVKWSHDRYRPTEEEFRQVYADFAMFDGKGVSISHYTAVTFLERYLPNIIEKPELMIAERCLIYLSNPDFKSAVSRTDMTSLLERFPLLGYAADHWHEHLVIGGIEDNRLIDRAVDILLDDALLSNTVKAMTTLKHESGVTGLHLVAFLGIADLVDCYGERLTKFAHKKVNINTKTKSDETVLHFAVKGGHCEVIERLLQLGVDVNAKARLGRTALHKAIEEQHEELVLELLGVVKRLDMHLDVDAIDEEGYTPLISAARYGMVDTVKALANAGANLDATANDAWSALRWAASNNYDLVVEELLNKDVTIKLGDWSLLHWAAAQGKDSILQNLISKGADVDLLTEEGTALMCAIRHNNHSAVWFLIEAKAKLDIPDLEGNTALHIAVETDESISWLLLESGANPSPQNNHGDTPLHLAASLGKAPIAWLLMFKGSKVGQNKRGDNPLHIAVASDDAAVVRTLLYHGSDTMSLDASAWTPLHIAAREGAVSVAHLLIANGADVNVPCQDTTLKTPLHIAAEEGQDKFVSLLIVNAAVVDAKDGRGWTPLHAATNAGNKSVMEVLLTSDANPNVRNTKGFTPLHTAAKRLKGSTVGMLLDHCADLSLQDRQARTAVHWAMYEQDDGAEVTRLLIESATSKDLDLFDDQGYSAVHIAVSRCHRQSLIWLAEYGADINMENEEGDTALAMALYGWEGGQMGMSDMLSTLITEGADVNRQSAHDGWTALHLAAALGLTTAIAVMYEKANPDRRIPDNEGKTPVQVAKCQGHEIDWTQWSYSHFESEYPRPT